MTIHNSSSSNLVLGFIQTPGIRIAFLQPLGWELVMWEVWKEVMIPKDNNRRLLLVVPPVDHQLRETSFYSLIG